MRPTKNANNLSEAEIGEKIIELRRLLQGKYNLSAHVEKVNFKARFYSAKLIFKMTYTFFYFYVQFLFIF